MEASEIMDFVQTAASEIGYEHARQYQECPKYTEPEYKEVLDRAAEQGCSDLGGILADHIYDDIEFIQGLIGDRIYGEPNREELLDHISTYGENFRIIAKNLRR